MDSKTKTYGYILLDTIGREVEAADGEHRRLSLECLCRAMAVDVVLATGYFGELLTAWRQCLPLGEVSDVTFSRSGSHLQRWVSVVTAGYRRVGVKVDTDACDRETLEGVPPPAALPRAAGGVRPVEGAVPSALVEEPSVPPRSPVSPKTRLNRLAASLVCVPWLGSLASALHLRVDRRSRHVRG